jgi:hypothetical protein
VLASLAPAGAHGDLDPACARRFALAFAAAVRPPPDEGPTLARPAS